MIILNGKYAQAKIFTDIIDEASISQITSILNQPVCEGSNVRIMPDVHAGSGCTIGTTMTISDKIVPNLVGVDIGCGMETIVLKEKHIEVQQLDKLIYKKIPSGFEIREKPHRYAKKTEIEKLFCVEHVNIEKAFCSIGTLGGGNHFIEANKGSDGKIYIVIHSGSRHLGLQVAKYYQKEAYRVLNSNSNEDIQKFVEKLKSEGKHKQIQSELKKLENTKRTNIPKHLAYAEGEIFKKYIHDMKIVQKFAEINRQAMMDEIIKGLGLHVIEQFSTIHNYIDTENMILRKGAVSAQKDEKLIIPINMCDGSLICRGKGNPDWNYSAPHGSGRLMSRSEAKQSFTVSQFKKVMKNVYSTSICQGTLDECPMAYKPIEAITENINDTVDIVDVIKPIYNFKAGDSDE